MESKATEDSLMKNESRAHVAGTGNIRIKTPNNEALSCQWCNKEEKKGRRKKGTMWADEVAEKVIKVQANPGY